MLYHLFQYLNDVPGARLFEFLTPRAAGAVIVSLIISWLLGGKIVKFLRNKQVGETVRDLGLDGQKEKEGTPTMGGIIIIASILVPTLLFARLDNIYILIMIFATVWMGIIGFADDYIKVFKKDKQGLKGIFKVIGQIILGIVVALTMLLNDGIVVRMSKAQLSDGDYRIVRTVNVPVNGAGEETTTMYHVKTNLTNVPFFKGNRFDYRDLLWFLGDNAGAWVWIIFVPFVIFIVTAVSNAANLTDGIDGLATGVSAIIGITLAILAYVSGNAIFADYLNILYIPNTGELVIFCAAFLGACIGFLWYNSHPAQVFMGDTGSLTLGGIIAALAILIRKELLIPILCGLFLVEALSVVLQVSYFKYTKRKFGVGRRIFKMSPLHHHFQKAGMHESKIVTRFWIVGILLAVLTLVTLKVR